MSFSKLCPGRECLCVAFLFAVCFYGPPSFCQEEVQSCPNVYASMAEADLKAAITATQKAETDAPGNEKRQLATLDSQIHNDLDTLQEIVRAPNQKLTVRGGSVGITTQGNDFTVDGNGHWATTDLGAPAKGICLENVSTTKGGKLSNYFIGTNENWIITVYFRKSNTNEDKNKKLTVCSYLNGLKCEAGGSITNTVSFTDDQGGDLKPHQSPNKHLSYDRKENCPECNHISTMVVSTKPASTPRKYYCPVHDGFEDDGKCNILLYDGSLDDSHLNEGHH